jgi:hypothetical protein
VRKVCGDCGRGFDAKRDTAKFCSDLCRVRAGRKRKSAPAAVPDGSAKQRDWQPGPVEAAVRADLGALLTAHPFGESIAAASVRIAQLLDYGGSLTGMAQANRALLDNVTELTKLAVDDGDDLGDALSVAELPPAVRDTEDA